MILWVERWQAGVAEAASGKILEIILQHHFNIQELQNPELDRPETHHEGQEERYLHSYREHEGPLITNRFRRTSWPGQKLPHPNPSCAQATNSPS